jgi:hypothetical protein
LAAEAKGEYISIPQSDGPPKRFPKRDLLPAFRNLTERRGKGADAPPEHPLNTAARNSPDPKWQNSYYASGDESWTREHEDLSE